jgi:hypothetical protein
MLRSTFLPGMRMIRGRMLCNPGWEVGEKGDDAQLQCRAQGVCLGFGKMPMPYTGRLQRDDHTVHHSTSRQQSHAISPCFHRTSHFRLVNEQENRRYRDCEPS